MNDADAVLVALVMALLFCTVHRCANCQSASMRLFYRACVVAQANALLGIATSDAALVYASHVAFTASVWLGALVAHDRADRFVISAACVAALSTRRAYGKCLFSSARGSTALSPRRYDLLYAIPLVLCHTKG